MMTRLSRFISAALLAAILSGCAPAVPPDILPTPAPTPLPIAPVGDRMAVRRVTQVVYYLSPDGGKLRHVLRTIAVLPGETILEALMTELMTEPDDPSLAPIFPRGSDMYLLDVEQSRDVATVNLTGRFYMLDRAAQFSACAAIANTLTELSDIRYVNVLVDGRDVSGYIVNGANYLPGGALSRVDDIAGALAQAETEYARIEMAESLSDVTITRRATLYFASDDGEFLIPEVRELEMDCSNMIAPVVDALIRGPGDASLSRTLPAGVAVRSAYAEFQGTDIVAVVELRAGADKLIADPQIAYASLTHTLMTFVPGISGVRFRIDGKEVDLSGEGIAPPLPETPVSGADGGEEVPEIFSRVYTRSDFSTSVGRNIKLYFSMADGRLRAVERTMTQREAAEPRNWLKALLAGMTEREAEGGEPLPFPEGFTQEEIIGIALSGETALVNITQKAASGFAGASQTEERAWIYALINTLTVIPGIRNVRFLVEGVPVETLGGGIWLREALLPNPGIVER